jgi:5-(carboxyamino)imidazole ribonucleotide mutase
VSEQFASPKVFVIQLCIVILSAAKDLVLGENTWVLRCAQDGNWILITSEMGTTIMSKPIVSIVMGSDSDLEIMRETAKALDEFGIAYEIDVTSAHRSPDRTADYARNAAQRGIRVIIAGAGGAAHLAGVIAAHTTLPVIGVPIPSTSLQGIDSLLATVQMPAGIPVATVAIGKPGATNAGILAAQILGLGDTAIAKKLVEHKEKLARGVEEKSKKLHSTMEE